MEHKDPRVLPKELVSPVISIWSGVWFGFLQRNLLSKPLEFLDVRIEEFPIIQGGLVGSPHLRSEGHTVGPMLQMELVLLKRPVLIKGMGLGLCAISSTSHLKRGRGLQIGFSPVSIHEAQNNEAPVNPWSPECAHTSMADSLPPGCSELGVF